MPGFCGSCGAPITGAFCGKCGQPAQAPSAPPLPQAHPAAQQTAQPAVAPAKSSGLGKVLLIVGGILVVMFALGIAGVFYGVHFLKNKVSTITGGVVGGSPDQVKVAHGNSCALLSKEDLQQVLEVTVEKTAEISEGSEPGCAYYTNPAAFAQLQRMAVEQARRDSEKASKEPAPKSDNPLELLKHTQEMEGIVKSLVLSQAAKEGRVFSFTLQQDFGRNNWSTMRTTMSAIPGFDDVPGAGDAAMIGSFGHALYVLKGDTMVHLDMTFVPEARTRGADIARKIVAAL